jgi:hypothetical protein
MHPAVLAGGIGALDAALLGIYALYVKDRKRSEEARGGRREVTPFPTYRRPVRRPEGQGQLKGGPGKDILKGGAGKNKQVR